MKKMKAGSLPELGRIVGRTELVSDDPQLRSCTPVSEALLAGGPAVSRLPLSLYLPSTRVEAVTPRAVNFRLGNATKSALSATCVQ